MWSAVTEIEVAEPKTYDLALTYMFCVLILAIVPSPEPTMRSPFISRAMQLTPLLNRVRTGPTLFSEPRSRLNSMMSPVLVPAYAN